MTIENLGEPGDPFMKNALATVNQAASRTPIAMLFRKIAFYSNSSRMWNLLQVWMKSSGMYPGLFKFIGERLLIPKSVHFMIGAMQSVIKERSQSDQV